MASWLRRALVEEMSHGEEGESSAVRRVRLAAGTTSPESSNSNDEQDFRLGSFRERALEEKCGVFGVISNGDWPTSLDVAQIICLGLVGLQHRGQESAGIVTCKYKTEAFNVSRAEGLVSSAFNDISMRSLKGNLGLGHTRYSTAGGSGNLQLAQPFVVHTKYGTIAVAHNGELVNSNKLRENLLSHGVGLSTGSDSELITQCLSQPPPEEFKFPKYRKKSLPNQSEHNSVGYHSSSTTNSDSLKSFNSFQYSSMPEWKADITPDENTIASRLLYLMSLTPVSYSLIVMYNECLYATRDPFGNRPLTIGMLTPPPNAGDLGSIPFSVIDNCFVDGWCISSESCPFPSVHAKLKRDVEPGEIVKFERNKLPKTLAFMSRPGKVESPSFCIFEYVYFARPDSIIEGQTVYTVRKNCGERLAIESPAVGANDEKRDFIVAPVPESSIPAALGYSQKSGIPYVEVFCKNRYVGRTFIQPSTRLRRLGVAKKFGPLTENFAGKSIVLIDDSIVRGTTIGQLVRLLREAGAKAVHIRIASPPLRYPCYMGINIPTKEELIANHLGPSQLALTLGAASLKYLSVEGLRESVQSGIREQLLRDGGKFSAPTTEGALKSTMGSISASLVGDASRSLANLTLDDPTSSKSALEELSEEDRKRIRAKVGHCDACLTGAYPVELDEEDETF